MKLNFKIKLKIEYFETLNTRVDILPRTPCSKHHTLWESLPKVKTWIF